MSGILLALLALQTATTPRQFDVVSVKPSNPGAVMQDMRITFPSPGRIEARNITLNEMLLSLSGFSGRVEGGPKWTASERFDVLCKSEEEIPMNQRSAVFLAMLADRFKLAIHHETKDEPGFALAVGKTPPRLTPAKPDELMSIRGAEQRHLMFQSVTMFDLVNYLGQILRAPVIDRTGLPGRFDFSLEAEDPAHRQTLADYVRDGIERLGFRMESRKISRDVTIIDQVSHPNWN